VVVAGNFINGASQSDAAKVYVYGGISLQSGGFFQTGSGSLLKVYGTVQSGTPNVSVQLGNVGDPAGSAGFLGGSGTIGNPSSPISVVNNAGTVNPGDPQILTIDGDYFQGANGALDINIDGPGGAGVGNDKLVVNGDVTLGGTLDLIFGNGYAPTGPIEFLDFTGSLTGRFGTLEETVGGNTFGLPGMISYGANGITFTPQAVPEPGCWLAFGAGGLVLFRRRKAAKISK
jgi:hypothetical protein